MERGIRAKSGCAYCWPLVLLIFMAICSCSILCSYYNVAYGAQDRYAFANTKEQQKFYKITKKLRCNVCQNQTIFDSNAELSIVMKNKVYELIRNNKTEDEILEIMNYRYGDFILYAPKFSKSNWLLWGAPFVLLFSAVIFWLLQVDR